MKKNIKVISNPAFIVFLGALISAFGGWWAYYKQESDGNKNQKELRDKDNEIIALQKRVIQTTNNQLAEQRELRKKSDQIAELNAQIAEAQKELYKKSEELIKQNKNTNQLISGEGSFCVIYILPTSTDQASIMVQQRGETALSGLKFSIMTEYDNEQLQTSLRMDSSLSALLKAKSEIGHPSDVGMLGVGISRILAPMPYKWKKINIFHINVMAVNGAWIENFEYNNGQIKYRILKVERQESPNTKPKILEQKG